MPTYSVPRLTITHISIKLHQFLIIIFQFFLHGQVDELTRTNASKTILASNIVSWSVDNESSFINRIRYHWFFYDCM